jgi:large subunit ribosomal protein L40e
MATSAAADASHQLEYLRFKVKAAYVEVGHLAKQMESPELRDGNREEAQVQLKKHMLRGVKAWKAVTDTEERAAGKSHPAVQLSTSSSSSASSASTPAAASGAAVPLQHAPPAIAAAIAPAAASASAAACSAACATAAPIDQSSNSAMDELLTSALLPAAGKAAKIWGVSAGIALNEFRRFLFLKSDANDVEGHVLSPTPLMDYIWHAAILDTRFYRRLQQKVGMQLEHSPAGASEDRDATENRELRLNSMRIRYHAAFDADPIELPTYHVAEEASDSDLEELPADAAAAAAASAETGPGSSRKRQRTSAPSSSFSIEVKMPSGKTIAVGVRSTSLIKDVKQMIQAVERIPEKQQRFIFCGKRLENHRILDDYNIQPGSAVQLMWVKYGGSMKTTVKTLTGKSVDFHVNTADSVESLKQKIHNKKGIPDDKQRLIFFGRQMQDGHVLSDYGVYPGCQVHLVLKLGGC